MQTKRAAQWQTRAAGVLEPGEQVTAAATGTSGGWLFWLLPEISWFRDHSRAYLVTNRNVYVCRVSSTSYGEVQGVLAKQPLDGTHLAFRRNRLTLDGAHPMFVGLLPIGRRWAVEVMDAATTSPSSVSGTEVSP